MCVCEAAKKEQRHANVKMLVFNENSDRNCCEVDFWRRGGMGLDGMNARKKCEQNQYLYITALAQTRGLPTVHINDSFLWLKPMEMLGIQEKKKLTIMFFFSYNIPLEFEKRIEYEDVNE